MTREINGRIVMRVSNDGTRCAAECPHRDGGYGHCTTFDKPLVLDLGHGAYDRCPTCISAEQAAASSGHLDGGARALDASEALRDGRSMLNLTDEDRERLLMLLTDDDSDESPPEWVNRVVEALCESLSDAWKGRFDAAMRKRIGSACNLTTTAKLRR